MELNHPMSIFAMTQQQQLPQNQPIPQPYGTQRVPLDPQLPGFHLDPQLPGFHSGRLYRDSDYYNSYAQEGPRQYSVTRMSPMSFIMNFQPECKPYSYTSASQNLMQGTVHYDPGHPSPSDRSMYPYPRPSSSSRYSYITSQTGTETFTQDGTLPSVFQSNQPALPSPVSCSYAESHLGSSPVYLQNQSTPSYNKDHRSLLQKVVGVPQDMYGNMAAEDLFFIKASQYGIQVMEKQSGCKDMKVEQVIDSVKEEKANLFRTKASQNGIMIESPPETKETLDFLPIAKEEKAKDNNPNCSFLLDVQAKTNASAIKEVQWYNNYGENVSNKFEVDGESMAKKVGSIYSASWSAEKFTSISDTDNRYSKFTEQSRLSPTQIWMMDGKHEDILRDGSLEGIEQTVLDALNLQVASETEDDDALSWEVEMAQEEKIEGKEEGQSLGVELEDEESIKEAAKCLVETIITGALKELGEEEHFSKEEEKKVDDYQSEIKVDDYWSESKLDDYQSETKVDDYWSESKVDDYQSETKVDDYQSESKVDDYQNETKVDDNQSETKVDDYWSESKVGDYWSETKVDDNQSETKVDDYWSESKVGDYWSESKVDDYQSETKVDDYQSESKVDDYQSETKVDDNQSETKVDDYWSETKVGDYWSEPKVDDYWSETKVGDYWSESKVGDYWSEIVTEGKEISTTEEQSVAREIIVDSVIHTLDDPGSVGDDPGLMSANRSSEIEKNDLKENKVFQKQPQNKKFDSVLINDSLILKSMDGVILKSTDGDITGHTSVCASKVDGQFERSFSLPPFCFEFNPELPEFKPGLKKIGDNWKKAYAINVDAPEEFRASLNAVTEEDTKQYVDSEPFFENSWVIDDRMINFEASDFQMKTYLDVGQEHEKSSATHKLVLKLNADCPEFKPESRKISTIRPDAPEFTPCIKTFFQPPHQDVTCKIKPKAKVLHLVMPKVVEKFKSVDIQASVEVKDSSSLTRKVKTRDSGTYTGSCDHRDVCVNTLESMACEKSKFYIPKEVMLLSTKSVSCGTEPQSTESIGINTDLGSYNKETELIEKLKQAQMELIQCRADLHVLQLEQTISKLNKEKKTLMEVFIGGEDKVLIDQIIDKRILKSRQEILNIEVSAKSWVKQIQMGRILDGVPALLFETETQGLRPAVGDFHQPVHMSLCKVIVSPVHGGFDAINIDSYKMDISNDRVMSSSKGPSLVDIKRNEYTDLREAGPVFGKSLKPCLSPVDSIQAVHSVGPNGQFSPEIMVSQRHREFSAQSTSPHMVTIQHMGAEPRVQDSQTTNTLPVKDWWYLDENIEDTRKAWKVQRSRSLVQKAEHLDEGPGKNDVTVQGSDVEVKSGTQPPWHNMMLDREGSEDVEVKSDTQSPWHNMMLDREGSEDVEVKSDTQPPWHNMTLDGEGSEDVEVKSDTKPPWHNMMLDREGSEDVEVKSDTQPPWHNMMLDGEGSEDVKVKNGTQPPWHNMMLDREGSEDVEVKSDTQPLQHDMALDRESSEDVKVKSDTQPPWHKMTLDREGSEDVEVKSETQPPWHNMMLDREGSKDVKVKSDTQPPWHNMMLDREGSEDEVEGTQNDSLDRDRQLRESKPDFKIIVNFNSALPIVNEKGVMITHRISEGEISGSEKEIKKTTSSDFKENAVKSTMLGSDETLILAESVRKTEAVTDFQENKLSFCSSGFESMKVGSFDHNLEKDQDTSNIKVIMDSGKDYVKEINSNSNNNDINVVKSDTLCSALKFEVSDFSIMSKTKDVSSNKSQCDPISTETLVHDLIVNSLEDSHLSIGTGETVIVNNDVTTNDLLPSNGHCSIAVNATDPEIIPSSLFRHEMPLGDSVGITDPAIISVSGSVSKTCSQISHASVNELTIMDGISSQKSISPSMEQQTVVVSTAEPTTYSDSIKTKTESEVGFNLEVGNTRVKTTPSPVNVKSVLNLANEAVPNLDSGAGTVSGVLDPADAEGVSVSGTTFFSPGLNPAEGFTPVPMPSLSSLFMPAFSMPPVQTDRLGTPQRSTTSPPIEGMVLAAQKGIPDPANGIMGVDPILYQTVLAQIMKAYPDLSKNSEMLRSLALQQTTLLQFYISGAEGHFNLTEPVPQSSVQSQLGTTGPCRLWTEFEGTGMNVLVHSDSKESIDIPKKPLAPPPGNLPTVFSSGSSSSTLVSKGFDFTSAVECALKPIDGASSSVPTSELSFSFANTAGSFTATAKIDTKTKSETTHSNLHPNLSVTSKTDQVHSKAAQEDDAEENINSAAETETSTQTRTSSSSECHKNELDVLHKNKELLIQDVESPKLSGSHLGSTQTKPNGSLQNLHGASSNREPPGQESNEKKTLMPQPGQESNEKKTLMPQPGQESNEKKTLMPQPGQASNEKKTLMPQPGQESNEKKTLMPQPGQAGNEKKTLMPQPGQASNEKKTLMPQPGQESNEKKTLMPQPGQASNEKKTLMPQPEQESNEKKTLMPQPGQAGNEKKTLMPQPGQESNEKKTLMPQPGQASNEKKTLMPQPGQASNEKKTLMPQPGQESNEEKTLMPQPGQAGNEKKTLMPQPGQAGNEKKTLMPQPGHAGNGKKTLMPLPGQESNEKKTLISQPDFASYPVMPPWAAQPSILQPRFGSNLMMPLMAAQPQLILSQYVKPNGLPNQLSPLMAQPRVFCPRVIQPRFIQHQPQKPHFMKPQHSLSSGWQHGFPQSTLGLPQNVRQQNFSSPADEHNDSTKGASNHNITRETSVPHRTPDSDKHNITSDTSVPHKTLDFYKHSITMGMPVPQRTPGSDDAETSEFTKTVKSTPPSDKFISNFVRNEISKSAEKLNVSGLCPITTQSTAFSSKLAGVGSDTTVVEPKLGSPFGSEEAGQPDFLPSFVKTDQYTSTRKHTPPVSKTTAIPELLKTQSWKGATWDARENWDDEVDEYPKPFKLERNVKREITGFNGSYSDVVKPRDSKLTVEVAKVKCKNEETNSTNPWASQVQGHQGIVTSDENCERKEDKKDKQEESWTEVTKKKKKDTSKQEPFASNMTKLGTVSQTKASNFEKLIQKLMECFSNMTSGGLVEKRSELIDVITQMRKSRGGSLSGMTMKDIVDKAGEVIMAKQHQRHKSPCLPPENMENEEDICVICHDGLSMEETKTLDCGHIFHSQCIKQWVLGRERTCPNCRSLALFPEEFPHLCK